MTKKTTTATRYEVRPVWFVSVGTWLVSRTLLLLLLVAFVVTCLIYLTNAVS